MSFSANAVGTNKSVIKSTIASEINSGSGNVDTTDLINYIDAQIDLVHIRLNGIMAVQVDGGFDITGGSAMIKISST